MKYNKMPISAILRSPCTVFTFRQIALIWGGTDAGKLEAGVSYYARKGELYRIRKGIYSKDRGYDRFELATRIYTPAYVSFETVLAAAGVTFQKYDRIFVASYQTREIFCDGQSYAFRKIRDEILTNISGIDDRGNYFIASRERAFLDTLYLNREYHFDNLSGLDWEIVFELLPMYENKRMKRAAEALCGQNRQGGRRCST